MYVYNSISATLKDTKIPFFKSKGEEQVALGRGAPLCMNTEPRLKTPTDALISSHTTPELRELGKGRRLRITAGGGSGAEP